MSDCIFCQIRDKQIPSQIVYEDENVLAFNDIQPQAPVHVLIVSKKHIPSLTAMTEADDALLPAIFGAIRRIAIEAGIAERGFRVITNCGQSAGQTVGHLHFHLLGGKDFD
ncbi:MAG: histidine triad nucleotide-binding protein [bacterium]